MSSFTTKPLLQTPSKLSKILSKLNAKPKLSLVNVKSLKLTYAYKNDHFGVRHFAKEDLPRIRWANPNIDIHVEKALKTAEEKWKPELQVEFQDGKSATFDLQAKYSSAIVRELMDAAGGEPWQKYKAEAIAAGHPVIPGEDLVPPIKSSRTASKSDLPNLQRFRELNPPKPKVAPIPEPTPSLSEASPAP